MNKLTTQRFIEKAAGVHNNLYDYSLVNYKTSHTKIDILCKKHGIFQQSPNSHLNGSGCPSCGWIATSDARTKSVADFIAESTAVHSGKYNYDFVVYVNTNTKVKIICPVHGIFLQNPSSHLIGKGCKKCASHAAGKLQLKSQADFINECVSAHGLNYGYTEAVYSGIDSLVRIKCNSCGNNFDKTPYNHVKKLQGCPICSEKQRVLKVSSNTSEFIEKASDRLDVKWDYSRVDYVNSKLPVLIGCPSCLEYIRISPANLLHGKGCVNCAKTGYNPIKSGTLYILKSGDITKIGITNISTKTRVRRVSRSFGAEFIVLKEYHFEDGSIPDAVETEALRHLKTLYEQPNAKFDGYTECFMSVNYQSLLSKIEELITIQKEKNGTY